MSQSLQIAAARCVTPLFWLVGWIDSDADFQNNGQAPMQWEIFLGKKILIAILPFLSLLLYVLVVDG